MVLLLLLLLLRRASAWESNRVQEEKLWTICLELINHSADHEKSPLTLGLYHGYFHRTITDGVNTDGITCC